VPKTPNPFEKQFFKLCVTSFLKWLAGGVCLLLAFMPLPKWVRNLLISWRAWSRTWPDPDVLC
jgi:hypothetical protein